VEEFTIENILGDAKFNYTCPSCKKDFSLKFKQVQKDNSKVICPYCNVEITFVQTPESKQSQKEMQESLNSLKKTIDNLGN
jgi:uncharacterized Zn finger protein (UPF0148 family)